MESAEHTWGSFSEPAEQVLGDRHDTQPGDLPDVAVSGFRLPPSEVELAHFEAEDN